MTCFTLLQAHLRVGGRVEMKICKYMYVEYDMLYGNEIRWPVFLAVEHSTVRERIVYVPTCTYLPMYVDKYLRNCILVRYVV